MHQKSKDIQLHYEGFLQTPCLWESNSIYQLHQFNIEQKIHSFDQSIDIRLRLGKYVERLISHQFIKDTNIDIIAENIQIQQGKQTLGELDFIIAQNNKPIHLEVIYKFYLYELDTGNDELLCWIGPNRKDSLIEKLEKLKQKQLPLLYSEECQDYLKSISLDAIAIEQQIYFKAQLFVPLHSTTITFTKINNDCIAGFYINRNDLGQFKKSKFYIPNKKDWLMIPHTHVNWISHKDFLKESDQYLERKFSPMCWMKSENGQLQKFFLVWWP